jgi:hypothetical protein
MSIATLSTPGQTHDRAPAKRENNEPDDEQVVARIDGYITECRSICDDRFINERTREEYEKMWAGLRAEKKVKEMSENSRYLYETIAAAKDYKASFELSLDNAVKNKWIGEKTRANWVNRFNDESVLEWNRKAWIKKEFPKYMKGWQETAKTRKDVWRLSKKLKVTEKEIPELADVLKIQDFLSLHFLDRKNKINAAKAKLLALDRKSEQVLGKVQSVLKAAKDGGYLHRSKEGTWMRRVMESENPAAFLGSVLEPYIANWMQVKDRYDAVMPALKKEPDKMRGFKQLNENQFLLLDYDSRVAYMEEAESRLESDVNEPGKLAGLRLDIRHAMDTEDWEEAERLLGEAQTLDPDDKAVRSMGRYLASHRTDTVSPEEKEQTEAQKKGVEALDSQREIMAGIPTNMRTMTEWAMRSMNPNAVKRIWQIFYNRHWVITHGYSTAQKDKEESFKEENREETEESIVNGHDWRFARRLIKGDTANDKGIRDECVKPQVIYTNRGGLREVYEGVERNADNAKFGYWTTLIDDEVPYESLREALQFMYEVRKNDRLMREAGIVYSSHGTPFSVN